MGERTYLYKQEEEAIMLTQAKVMFTSGKLSQQRGPYTMTDTASFPVQILVITNYFAIVLAA